MDDLSKLFEDKLKIVLNLIRTNNTGDEALKITQAVDNLVRARNSFTLPEAEPKTIKKQGTGAS